MATIKQYETKKGKFWYYKAYLGIDPSTGKQVATTKRGFKTKKEAQLALSRLQVDYEKNGLNKPAASQTFQEIFDLWKENFKLTVKESTYCKAISQYEVHTLPVFGKKKIDEITVTDIQKFANDKVKTKKKYRDFITDISRIFEYAMQLGLVTDNPTKRIIIPKRKQDVTEERIKNYYTKDELQLFLDCCKEQESPKIYAFFQLLSASGCRQGELLGLEWRFVDFKEECIHINQTLARGENRRLYIEQPKTKHSKRTVSLDHETMKVLRMWKKEQAATYLQLGINTNRKDQLVFPNVENSFIQLSKPRTWMLRVMRNNNLRIITIHGFRHTHATLLLEAGVPAKTISERLGHSTIQITHDLYIHVTEKMEKKTPQVFASIMARN
ncbi:site-specific integrase [Enterococcus diestrammenae]|uniref:site-specific integrase n=1 Tax=Enterococcus diestrammenae TaxID=1155073 RepID=UPI0019562755